MADLQFTVSALDKATAALLKVAAQLDKVGDKLDKLDGKVAKVTAALDDKASPGLDNIERKVKNLDGKKATVKVDVDKSLGDTIVKFSLLSRALKSIALPAAAVAAAPQIAALGSAAVTAAGAVGALPGLLGAAGLAAGTFSLTFGKVWKVVAGSDKEAKEAFNSLSESGRDLAGQIREIGRSAEWTQARMRIQDAAFQGLAAQVKPLASAYLPMLQREMTKVAEGFNVAGTALAKFFQQKNTVSDIQGAFMSMRIAVNNTIVALKPLAQAFTDIFVTSTARLPNLTKGIGEAAAHFAAFIKTARETGQLGQWIDQGVKTVALLGTTLKNVGSIILSVFRSATAEGANLVQTLANVTGQAAAFLKSAQGQDALKAVFGTIREAIAAVIPVVQALLPLLSTALVAAGTSLVKVFQALGPPLKAIADALANALAPVLPGIADAFGRIALALVPVVAPAQALIPAFHAIAAALSEAAKVAADFFSAMAATGVVAFRALVPLITAAVQALTGLLHVIEPIAPALGVIVAAFLAFKAASAGIALAQGALGALGGKISEAASNAGVLTEKFTGSAAAGEKVATAGEKVSGAFSKVGAALPVVGLAIAALGVAYEEFGSTADRNAQKVITGSQSLQQAIAAEQQQVEKNVLWWNSASEKQAAYADAAARVTEEFRKQYDALSPYQKLTTDVAIAQSALNDAVAQFGPKSAEAQTAAANLASAKDRLKTASQGAADAEKSLGDQIVDTMNAAAAAANADLGYQQSLLSLRDAQDRAAEAARSHAAGSREVTTANLAVEQASLAAAAAAQRKAEADATAAGASNVAQIGAQAYKDELLRQAATMEGPNKQALIDLANGTNTAKQAQATAEIQARLQKEELQRLADTENGPLKAAIEGTIRDLGNAGGAHATAQQKADAQRAMLQRLADQASGPTRQAILDMIKAIDSIHDKSFTVTGTGVVRSTTGSTAPGAKARGGILDHFTDGGVTPGYTPGRDVHTFRSATGGTLHLSGGEAVMRPEFTRAVGATFVNQANAAARGGGVAGVRQYMATGRYATGGVIGRFASGGIVLNGTQPFRAIPQQLDDMVTSSLIDRMKATIMAAVQAIESAMASAFGAVVNLGGGDARSWIIAHESGGNPRAQNPTSTASGLYQFINGTWKAYGGSTPTAAQASVAEQNAVADRYVASRYGSWENAKAFWVAHHWYDRGGYLPPGVTMAVNNTGTSERILSPAETQAYGQRGNDALIAAVQGLRMELRALRGDVDHHGDQATIAGEIRGLRYQLAASGSSAAVSSQAARTASELGAWA